MIYVIRIISRAIDRLYFGKPDDLVCTLTRINYRD